MDAAAGDRSRPQVSYTSIPDADTLTEVTDDTGMESTPAELPVTSEGEAPGNATNVTTPTSLAISEPTISDPLICPAPNSAAPTSNHGAIINVTSSPQDSPKLGKYKPYLIYPPFYIHLIHCIHNLCTHMSSIISMPVHILKLPVYCVFP